MTSPIEQSQSPSSNPEAIEYREIPSLPNYRFGSDGSIQSRWVRGSKKASVRDEWKNIRPAVNSRFPYHYVTLKTPSGRRCFKVSVLILTAFSGPKPEGMECSHKNGKSLDDRADNLAWKTHLDNVRDKFEHGTVLRGESCPASILSDEKVREIKSLIGTMSYPKIGRIYGLTESAVRAIANGRNWSHVPGEIRRRNFSFKLTNADIDAIRHRHSVGESQKSLAAEFGVVPSAISQIVNNKRRQKTENAEAAL